MDKTIISKKNDSEISPVPSVSPKFSNLSNIHIHNHLKDKIYIKLWMLNNRKLPKITPKMI